MGSVLMSKILVLRGQIKLNRHGDMLHFAFGSTEVWEDLVANVNDLRTLNYNVTLC